MKITFVLPADADDFPGDEDDVRRAAKKFGIDYPVAIATTEIVETWSVSGVPTTVVVDAQGTVQHAQVGAMSYEQLQDAVF